MKTTKGGKVMNPTDAYRKELRKKELKRNKKERKKVREVGILKKDPDAIKEQIRKLEMMKADGALDKTRRHKKRQLEDTLNLVMKKRKEYEEKMREKGEEPVMFSHLPTPRRRATAEEEERAKHPKPEDSVYFHPSLNPSGAPPPGKPPMYKSSIGPRIPLSGSTAGGTSSEMDTEAPLPLPPPPPPPPLPSNGEGASGAGETLIPLPVPVPPPPPAPPRPLSGSLPHPPPFPPAQPRLLTPGLAVVGPPPPPPPRPSQPPPPGTAREEVSSNIAPPGTDEELSMALNEDAKSLQHGATLPQQWGPGRVPPPPPPRRQATVTPQVDSKEPMEEDEPSESIDPSLQQRPPPPPPMRPPVGPPPARPPPLIMRPPPGPPPQNPPSSEVSPPGVTPQLPSTGPPPPPSMRPSLLLPPPPPARMSPAVMAPPPGPPPGPPPRPHLGPPPSAPPPVMRPPAGPPPMGVPPMAPPVGLPPPPPLPTRAVPEGVGLDEAGKAAKPSYIKSAAATVIKRPLAQHTPELTSMVPASVRVRRENAQKMKPKTPTASAASVPAGRPSPATAAVKPPSIDDSYSAFLEDMKALGAFEEGEAAKTFA